MTRNANIAAHRPPSKGLIVGAALIAFTLVTAVIVAKPGSDSAAPADRARPGTTATMATAATPATPATAALSGVGLSARDGDFDFGSISMAAGKVSHRYWLRNDSATPVMIKRIYTSCMCTTATLVKSSRVVGSYGMPGHGPLPAVNQTFGPGEAAYVDVEFDPAAHGPAGLGRTERVVSIESDAGQRLQLAFVANVRP